MKLQLRFFLLPVDYVELPAQVRAKDPYREGGRHPENDQQPIFPRDSVHSRYCLPK